MARERSTLDVLSAGARVVVAAGEEAFLRSQATRRLRDALRARFGDVGEVRFDGTSAALADVLDELRSFALLQPHKLVILDDAEHFLAADESADAGPATRTRRRAMEDYAANPSEGSTLLLRASSWRPGRIDRIIEKSGAFVPCKALSDAQATTWCATRGQDRYQVRVEPDAAELLVGLCGPDLCRLDAELGKLAAYVGDPGRVSRQDVATLVGRSREEKAWALQSAVLSGRPAVALTRLRELLEISRVPQELAMWAIGDLLRRLHAAAHMLRQGAVRSEVRSRLRLFGPDGDRIIELARRAGPARLARLLDRAVESDLATRTGLGEASRNLEVLSVEVSDTIGCV